MIGNDVIDLTIASIESNWNRPKFLDKVFTETEQQMISVSENKQQTVWLLWSMKEASYKIHVQQFGKRFFNPQKISCNLISENKGSVSIDGKEYMTQSIITKKFINTIATTPLTEEILTDNFKIEDSSYKFQSYITKEKLLNAYSKLKKVSRNHLEIRKSENGIPKLFYNNVELNDSFSISHHGFYGAYAI